MTRYLFTILPSNELVLLTRALPVATELAQQDFVLTIKKRWGKERVDVQALQAKISAVLTDPAYGANARSMRKKLLTYGGAPKAARLIEYFVQERRMTLLKKGRKARNLTILPTIYAILKYHDRNI